MDVEPLHVNSKRIRGCLRGLLRIQSIYFCSFFLAPLPSNWKAKSGKATAATAHRTTDAMRQHYGPQA